MRTYGTIRYDRGKWVVDCEPHVLIRLKRVFPRVSRRSHGTTCIEDTIETSRDLAWFLERFPMEADAATRARLDGRASEHRERESLVAELLAGRREPRSFDLALPPRDYQRVAADLALRMGGLLIADDVGLGKTATAICALSDPSTRPALVVTLTHLPRQWQAELARFAPELRTHILKSGTPYDLRAKPRGGKRGQGDLFTPELPDVIIGSYSKLAGWAATLAPIVRGVVFDEVQELRRGEESNKGAAAYHIAAHARLRVGLSATPIYNYGGEMYHVLQALRPGELGTWGEFSQEWGGAEGADKRTMRIADPKAFGAYLREHGLMIRRTRADVGRELPGLTRIPHEIDCDTDHLDRIQSSAAELARIILDQGTAERGARFRASEELSVLVRQATGVAKAPYVAEFVRLLVESGERVVLFGWHREVYSLWLERLKALRPALYTGTESVAQKEEARRRFVERETDVLIMSLRSGAGLDGLQSCCRTVVFGELDWSPGVHEQCIGRVARDGQTDPVAAYFLVASSGSDPIVADVLGVKRGQIEGVRTPSGELVDALDVGGGHIRRLAEAYLDRRVA